jgi:hypothetical protein
MLPNNSIHAKAIAAERAACSIALPPIAFFNEMSIDEKLDILQGCFGHEIRALSPPLRPQPPSRLG